MEDNINESIEDEIIDNELNSLIYDTELSKKRRVEIINSWPTNHKFEIEKVFSERLQTLNTAEAFRPVNFHYSNELFFQRSVACILDSLDFLPHRPDLAFDFIWRAIDFLSGEVLKERGVQAHSDKNILKATVDHIWTPYFDQKQPVKDALMKLIQNIPVQSCEYMFKRMYEHYEPSRPNNPNQEISRLVAFDGSVVRNPQAKQVIDLVKAKYPYHSDDLTRRNGSMFLYRYIKGDPLNITDSNLTVVNLSAGLSETLNFCISGILYTFRNDRAHGGVFSPFRSSKATLRTYAHCSFSFLLGYYLLVALIHSRDASLIDEALLVNNYHQNIELYEKLYGANLRK